MTPAAASSVFTASCCVAMPMVLTVRSGAVLTTLRARTTTSPVSPGARKKLAVPGALLSISGLSISGACGLMLSPFTSFAHRHGRRLAAGTDAAHVALSPHDDLVIPGSRGDTLTGVLELYCAVVLPSFVTLNLTSVIGALSISGLSISGVAISELSISGCRSRGCRSPVPGVRGLESRCRFRDCRFPGCRFRDRGHRGYRSPGCRFPACRSRGYRFPGCRFREPIDPR